MAKLSSMPPQNIVDSLAGVVDFYYWRGIPCARAWPRWPPRDPTPAEKANQDLFAYAVALYNTLPANIIERYRIQAASTKYTCRDLFMRSFLSGLDY